jgi:hypothetical protein
MRQSQKVRDAIRDIYTPVGKREPSWINQDESEGWPRSGSGIKIRNATVLDGADPDTPGAIKIVLVTPQGEERIAR